MKSDLPKSAKDAIDQLDFIAIKNNNAPQQIKAAIYRVSLQAVLDDDEQVSNIKAFNQRIKQSAYPVKPVLQSLLAQLYWSYYQQNRYRIIQRSKLLHPDADFTNWDVQTLINHTANLYELSLADFSKEQNTPISVLDGALQGDSTSRGFRPTLYDLLVHRAFDFFLKEEAGITKPRLAFTLNDLQFFAGNRVFAQLQVATADTGSNFYKGIKYLQQATLFHLQKQQTDALADLDLKRLEFVYANAQIPQKDSLYLNALQKITTSFSSSPVSADALVLQGRYYMERDSLKTALSYFNKAVAVYPKSLGGNNAANFIKQIHQTDISAITEDINLPGKPLLALLNYRNVKTAKITLYKIWASQYNELAAMRDERYGQSNTYIQPLLPVIAYLKKLKPIKIETLHLPGTDDYRSHSTEFKIDPLKKGIYALIVEDSLSTDPELLQFATFKVSQLAFASRNNNATHTQINVMDRETGAPLPGVQVTVAETMQQSTDQNGAAFFNLNTQNGYSVKLTTATDTLYWNRRYWSGFNNRVPAFKRTVFFTDREIYRPGQTVYFKGLCLNVQNGKSSLLVNENLSVNIKDNNGKQFTSLPVSTNEFGSFGGTFVIPQNILNGSVVITTPYGNKFIRVEEYKRPGFAVSFLPVKETYKPGDSVTIHGRVTAYSGYGLSQARVAYRVSRNPQIINYNRYNYRGTYDREITADTIKTNDRGEFEVKFKALVDDASDRNLRYDFVTSADVTSSSGETQTASTSILLGVGNLEIRSKVPLQLKTGDTTSIAATLTNLSGVRQSGQMTLRVYSLKPPVQLLKKRLWNKPDQYLLSKENYKTDFPEFAEDNEDQRNKWPVIREISALSLKTDGNIAAIFDTRNLGTQPTGYYKLVISAQSLNGDTVSETYFVNVLNKPAKPSDADDWVRYVNKDATDKSFAEFWLGTGNESRVLMEKFNETGLVSFKWLTVSGGNQQVIKVPVNRTEKNVSIQFLMVKDNRLYNRSELINSNSDDGLDIKLLTFRNKLQPGEKEQWKLQVSDKNNPKQVAEMVAGLYDASLDAIYGGGNSWNGILNQNYYLPFNYNWSRNITEQWSTHALNYKNYYFNPANRVYEQLGTFGAYAEPNRVFMAYDEITPGLAVASPGQQRKEKVLAREVSVGYGTYKKADITEYNSMNLPADVLKSVQLVDNYGDQANPGGGTVAVRKNFAETAFFYPQLRTDDQGNILIDFTIPESLTSWRFKAFAHTKDLKSGYIEREIITQKQLSIITTTPRFLREGDTIIVSATVANLTASALKGNVELKLFNGLNMQPVQLLANAADAKQAFALDAATNKAISFKLVIPVGLDALTYRITAQADQYSDGEENTLPVLSNRMLVTESMPMMVRVGQARAFTFDKLLKQTSTTLKSKTLTLEYTQNPAWYAVQALPYMMEYPYECSEQTFNRYYANSLASNLIIKMPVIKQVFDRWKAGNSDELLSNLEKNQDLKATLLEETPWLRDALSETEQKKRIALLFDLNKMSYELQANLDKLQQRQLPDGGFAWFGGDRADRYITQDILAGIGQLYHLGIADLSNLGLKNIADKAMTYLDQQLVADAALRQSSKSYDTRELSSLEIHSYYTQSYFTARALSHEQQVLLANYLNLAQKQWVHKKVYEQALIALTMLRNKKAQVAEVIIKSLLENARQSDDLGMYWAANKQGYYWYESPVETQSLMIELFTEAGNNNKAVDEMKIWLLRNKQTTNWQSTKATAAACYALLLNGSNLLSTDAGTSIKLDGKPLDELKSGIKADAETGYIKASWTDEQIKPALGKVELKNSGNSISWGALHWQYLENLDKITSAQTNIHLERKYFIKKQTATGSVLTAVDANHQPKTGDVLKVVVYLKADRDFEYVQLKDMRPSGTEPEDALSTYKYQDGLYYYQVTKDVATNFFISYLNKGNYVFEYNLRVVQPGSFSTGITCVQSMYAPEFNAHSVGGRMTVKP
ncbi:alpha-2-macroglobulin family protein [Mucilaginibacter dorajii]|uniref:Alpha-2-macroglobulin family protein n=2 Tax=Mucilaginibacter dorajii TaxID=692994 RepID=A0ABP7Q3B3_9SPHI|nr:uncharacterized protein YfaS (alpha-2-macroglobulin family) [Mucilaginibacter dorajii]